MSTAGSLATMVNKPALPKFKVISGVQTRRKRAFNDPVMNADEILAQINGILKKNPDRLISVKTEDDDGSLKNVNPLYKFGDLVIGPNDTSSFSIPCVVLEISDAPLAQGPFPIFELRRVLSEIGETTRKFCHIFIVSQGRSHFHGISSVEFKKTSSLTDQLIFNRTRQAFELGAGMDHWWEVSDAEKRSPDEL